MKFRTTSIVYLITILWALFLFIVALLFSMLPSSAHAACIVGDRISTNKAIHFGGEAAITSVAYVYTGDAWIAASSAAAVGIAREVWKVRSGYHCEYSSMLYDAAGIGFGLWLGQRIMIAPRQGGAAITYSIPLN